MIVLKETAHTNGWTLKESLLQMFLPCSWMKTIFRPKMVIIILSVCGNWLQMLQPMALGWRLPSWKILKDHVTIIPTWTCPSTPSLRAKSIVLAWFLRRLTRFPAIREHTTLTTSVLSFIRIDEEAAHLDNDFTGPTVKAALTMLAEGQARLPAQAPFPKSHPDAACAVIPLKCKPQIQLCLLWLRRPSVNTQRCHNVAITAGQYFNNNLFGQLQLHH